MKHLHQPHDRFFRSAFGRADLLRELLSDALPPGLLQRLDLHALELSDESFVDPELAAHQSDILVRTRLRGSPLLVYVLVEHKSYPYRWTLLQLLRYMVAIWERERSRNPRASTLPAVIPLIVYHGRRRWRFQVSFSGYFRPDKELAAFIPGFSSLLIDLRERRNDPLNGSLQYQAALRALQHAVTGLRPHLGEILRLLAALPIEEEHRAFVSALLEYILRAGKDVEAGDLETELQRVSSEAVREVYMTLAEKLMEQGKAQGKLEGKLEGRLEGELEEKRQVLLRLLGKKFGRLPPSSRRRITDSRSREGLDRAIDLVLEVDSIELILKAIH